VEHALTRRAATGVARGVRGIDAIAPLAVLALVAGLAREAGARETWGPFQGQVVDVETEQPIAGAVILVVWWEVCGIFGHECFVEAREAVTGAGGRFRIPRRTGFRWKLGIQPPAIHAFAPGYVAEAEIVMPITGGVYVDPTVLQMCRLKTREELLRKSSGAPDLVPQAKIPEYMRAVNVERAGLGFRPIPVPTRKGQP
jgi:hypothetical protein